jgi:hypothetical protein
VAIVSWPNGGGLHLSPDDYYRVRFVAPHDPGVVVGDVGIVVEHLESSAGRKGCAVEVGPWSEHGAPRDVVMVDASALEMLSDPVSEPERRGLALREHTRDAFEGPRPW